MKCLILIISLFAISCAPTIAPSIKCERSCIERMDGELGDKAIEWCREYASKGKCCKYSCGNVYDLCDPDEKKGIDNANI